MCSDFSARLCFCATCFSSLPRSVFSVSPTQVSALASLLLLIFLWCKNINSKAAGINPFHCSRVVAVLALVCWGSVWTLTNISALKFCQPAVWMFSILLRNMDCKSGYTPHLLLQLWPKIWLFFLSKLLNCVLLSLGHHVQKHQLLTSWVQCCNGQKRRKKLPK